MALKPSLSKALTDSIYSDTQLEHKDVQPIYILQRDTIRSFFYEKISDMSSESQFYCYLGIAITLLATVITATFTDIWIVKAELIKSTFLILTIYFIIKLIISGIKWIKTRNSNSPSALTDELGSRGSIIKPTTDQSNS